MGSGHYRRIADREPTWPPLHEASAKDQVVLAMYQLAPADPLRVEWLSEAARTICLKRAVMGISRDGMLVALARTVFPGDSTKVYTRDGQAAEVVFGAAGEELRNYDRSILKAHSLLQAGADRAQMLAA